jgi:hypothetical protein
MITIVRTQSKNVVSYTALNSLTDTKVKANDMKTLVQGIKWLYNIDLSVYLFNPQNLN